MIPTDTTETPDNTPLPVDTGGVTAPPADSPEHLARCAECGFDVRYRSSASGAGFTLIGSDAALGIGDNGRPVCPNGHGELAIADDQLPAAEAIAQVAEQLGAAPQRLPFPSPPFNYEGAMHEVFEKRTEVARLEARFNDADDRRKKAKAALDTANEELGEIIDNLHEREEERLNEIARREQRAEEHPDDTNLVRCRYEQLNPGATCPVCSDPNLKASCALPESEQHAIDAIHFLRDEAALALIANLTTVNVYVDQAAVHAWTPDQLAEVDGWWRRGGKEPLPAALGRPHVAADTVTSDAQPGDTFVCCRDCGARLATVKTGSGDSLTAYPPGALVGVDCPGPEPSHRYPEKKGKRGNKRQRDETPEVVEITGDGKGLPS